MEKSKGIVEYSEDILPTQNGESIVVYSIGLIALSDNYIVEKLTGNGIYKITKK